MGTKPVLISLVTHNDGLFLERCLRSVQGQSVPIRVKIFDNASRDETRLVAQQLGIRLFACEQNLGFGCGHNRNLRGEDFKTALLLNADVILDPDFLPVLLAVLERVEGAGMAGGKMYRMDGKGRPLVRGQLPVLDSSGIFFTPCQRHLDRGSEEKDHGQYDRRQVVFGITGAALLCKKAMLEDVSVNGEYLDEDFFAYREDADLAWRAQLRGWKAVYEPRAKALHRRVVIPRRRRQLSPHVNYHSLKNRYLMRAKNLDSAVRKKCFPYLWLRDLSILLYVLLLERTSLPAYREVWRLREKFRKKGDWVQQNRRIAPSEMARWFSFRPVAFDLE